MLPSELEELGELAHLSPEALDVLAGRFERLAARCRSRGRWLRSSKEAADAEFRRLGAVRDEKLARVLVLVRRGLRREAIAALVPDLDPLEVAHWYQVAKGLLRRPARPAQRRPVLRLVAGQKEERGG